MALVVKVGEAKTRLSELLHRVEAGEEVVLARGPSPVARLAPVEAGGRRLAALADLLEARARIDAASRAAELGLWRAIAGGTALPPATLQAGALPAPRYGAASDQLSRGADGPEAPPDSDDYVAAPSAAGGFVLEPSFAAAWLLPGPDRRAADAAAAALARAPARAGALAAPGFWAGLGDLLIAAQRRERVEADVAAAQWRRIGRAPIVETALADGLDLDGEGEARALVLGMALSHGLSFADAATLAFARARGLPVATNLPALARAATRSGVGLLTDLDDAVFA